MGDATDNVLTSILRDVSRSFYLTLCALPGPVRSQVGLAYLLARTTDTIADTEVVAVEKRLAALQSLRDRILGRTSSPVDFGDLAPHQASTAERLLLVNCEKAVGILETLAPPDRNLVRTVLNIITSGQELDLRRFAQATGDSPTALGTDDELDDYTYRVAGCVGEFWTRICCAHLFAGTNLDEARLLSLGVRFGKGLQLVNVLRDIPVDLRRGRCYLPTEKLRSLPLAPKDLLDPVNEPRLRPLYSSYLGRASDHLHAGWQYTNTLPLRFVRLRLACAWPILLGFETLELLKQGNVLDPAARIKVSRSRVKIILLKSVVLLPFPALWRRMAPMNQEAANARS